MEIINKIVISEVAPTLNEVGWLRPLNDGTFELKFNTGNGWTNAASGIKGDKGDPFKYTDYTPAQLEALKGADGKSIIALNFIADVDGTLTGGTATLSDNSTINITITKS